MTLRDWSLILLATANGLLAYEVWQGEARYRALQAITERCVTARNYDRARARGLPLTCTVGEVWMDTQETHPVIWNCRRPDTWEILPGKLPETDAAPSR
jgi:hypothetical protein